MNQLSLLCLLPIRNIGCVGALRESDLAAFKKAMEKE